MLFPTVDFAIFFVVVLTANWFLMPHPKLWRIVMLAASFFFYGSWDYRFTALLAGSILINQALAVAIHRSVGRRRHHLVTAAVAANLGILGFFKYYGFLITSVANTLQAIGLEPSIPLLQVVLPVGISFFTFQALSYVIDIYRGKFEPVPLLDFGLYLSFFPQLVAGPIVRAREFLPQLKEPRDPRRLDSSRAFYLIIIGLAKKIVIADFLATQIVDGVFTTPGQFSSLEVLIGIYGYAVQIYCDFSAYSDIAIGVALLLGFSFPDNFNAPYTAVSIRDFWRRWHMTLSRWLRDYLYIPLGGSRGSSASTYRNLMLTMLLGGLWHGAAWSFVLWGGLHGGWLAIERRREERRESQGLPEPPDTAGRRILARIVVFHLVCLGWVLFRAGSLTVAWEVMTRLATGWGPAPAVTPAILLAIAVGIGSQYVPRGAVVRLQATFSRLAPALQGIVLAFALAAIDGLGQEGVAAFIYFQF